MADNPQSMIYLEKYKSTKKTQAALIVGGSALVLIGLVTWINKTDNLDENSESEPNINGNVALIGVGAGCIWASYFISFSKPHQLRKAIDAYNE